MPPSTGIAAPVMNDEESLARKSAASATSSGLPVRPTGCFDVIHCLALVGSGDVPNDALSMGVSNRARQNAVDTYVGFGEI